jgi:hypothetical protein
MTRVSELAGGADLADLIVTGDRAMLELRSFEQVRIAMPRTYLEDRHSRSAEDSGAGGEGRASCGKLFLRCVAFWAR